jgi:hypothetical protein
VSIFLNYVDKIQASLKYGNNKGVINMTTYVIIIIIIIFLHGFGQMTYSGIDALLSFPRASYVNYK